MVPLGDCAFSEQHIGQLSQADCECLTICMLLFAHATPLPWHHHAGVCKKSSKQTKGLGPCRPAVLILLITTATTEAKMKGVEFTNVNWLRVASYFGQEMKEYECDPGNTMWLLGFTEESEFARDESAPKPEHPMQSNRDQILARVVLAYVLREELKGSSAREMLEPLLDRLKTDAAAPDDSDGDRDRTLLQFLEDEDTLPNVPVDSIRFTKTCDYPTFDETRLFSQKEWHTIFEFLLDLYISTGQSKNKELIRILKKHL